MDWSAMVSSVDWFAIVTVLIALIASFGEILSQNSHRQIGDILNRYLFLYLGINAICAFLTYWFLPEISKMVLKPENVAWADAGWGRSFVAAFGYLIIIRTKFLTIGEVPIGIDAIYIVFANYCIVQTNIKIHNKQSKILDAVYVKYKELKRYETALMEHLSSVPQNQKATFEAQFDAVKNANLPEYIKCKRLGELLLKIVGNQNELESALSSVPQEALAE